MEAASECTSDEVLHKVQQVANSQGTALPEQARDGTNCPVAKGFLNRDGLWMLGFVGSGDCIGGFSIVFPLLQAIQAAAASFLVALASTAAPMPASDEVPASAEAAMPDIAPMQQAAPAREIAASPVDRVSYSNLLQLVDEPGPHVVSV